MQNAPGEALVPRHRTRVRFPPPPLSLVRRTTSRTSPSRPPSPRGSTAFLRFGHDEPGSWVLLLRARLLGVRTSRDLCRCTESRRRRATSSSRPRPCRRAIRARARVRTAILTLVWGRGVLPVTLVLGMLAGCASSSNAPRALPSAGADARTVLSVYVEALKATKPLVLRPEAAGGRRMAPRRWWFWPVGRAMAGAAAEGAGHQAAKVRLTSPSHRGVAE